MTHIPAAIVLRRVRRAAFICLLAACVVTLPAVPADAQATGADTFSGLYAGIDAGRQQVIGGALVDGVDTLQEGSRLVTSVFGGLRAGLSGFVFGAELGIGWLDGTLHLDDPARALRIDYDTSRQWHWLLSAGHTVGASTLVFAYVSEVSRDFDVSVRQRGTLLTQQDGQGLLRFGGGVEHRLSGPLRLRVLAGTSRADFGDRTTNRAVGRRFELSGGAVVGF
ncbi:MAG: hypothetical protein AB7O67_20830 [Vicinamibacterales bacterium]